MIIYFGNGVFGVKDNNSYVKVSREISKIIPEYSNVYGGYAVSLNLENNLKTYFNSQGPNNEILNLLKNKNINYVILKKDLFDDAYSGEIEKYINENFEIVKKLKIDNFDEGIDRGITIYVYNRKGKL